MLPMPTVNEVSILSGNPVLQLHEFLPVFPAVR
jgi:hypothetical protein